MANLLGGRLAKFLPALGSGGAQVPKAYTVTDSSLANGSVHFFRFKAAEGGSIRHMSGYIRAINSTTVTIDIQIYNPTTLVNKTVLASSWSLVADTPAEREGFGAAATNINTVANKYLADYDKGDWILVQVTTGAGTPSTGLAIMVTCDERQPA